MKWKWTLVLVLVCAGLLLVLKGGFGRNPHEVPFMLKRQPAPSFALRSMLNGEEVKLESLRGRPVVINFWASWCGPCKMEHPVLEWGARQYGDEAQFLGLVFEDSEENARRFLQQYGATFPQLTDPRSRTAVDYGVAGVPETYFIDAQGIIRDKHVGPIDPETLAQRLRELSEPLPAAQAAQ